MHSYRKETDPTLIAAAQAAYSEAPPRRTGNRSGFARNLGRHLTAPAANSLAAQVRQADQCTDRQAL